MCIDEALVLRQLALVKELDAIARELQRIDGRVITGFHRGVDFICGDPQSVGRNIQPIELFRRVDQRHITTLCHIVHDRTRGRVDVSRDLALHDEKGIKTRGEVGGAVVETKRHCRENSLGVKSKSA